MRRHASPSSGSSGSGRLRLMLLAATAAAFLLVPAAQAFAEEEAHVNLAGTGTGTVTSENEFGEAEGSPPINCSGPPESGVCDTFSEGLLYLEAIPDPGSEFVEWTVEEGIEKAFFEAFGPEECQTDPHCGVEPEEAFGDVVVKATFAAEAAPEPHLLTASKTGSGNGWLHSEGPAYAINCGTACTTKSAELEGEVTLTASGAQFAGWESCPGVESGRSCTVEMDADKEAVAEYAANHAITVTKTGSGDGWVHSEGPPYAINCGAGCTTKTGFFESSTVVLTASGGQFTEWTSCPSGVISGRTCTINSSSAQSAEVKYGS